MDWICHSLLDSSGYSVLCLNLSLPGLPGPPAPQVSGMYVGDHDQTDTHTHNVIIWTDPESYPRFITGFIKKSLKTTPRQEEPLFHFCSDCNNTVCISCKVCLHKFVLYPNYFLFNKCIIIMKMDREYTYSAFMH